MKNKRLVDSKRRRLYDRLEVKNKLISIISKVSDNLSELKESRKGSLVRVKNRCVTTGRSGAVYKKYRASRMTIKDYNSKGWIPGLFKDSW